MLTKRQLDDRIRASLSAGTDPVAVCVQLQVSWQHVKRVLDSVADSPVPAETVAVLTAPAPAVIEPAPAADLARAIAFLRSKGYQIIAFQDGSYLLNDRDASATNILERAERVRGRMAGVA